MALLRCLQQKDGIAYPHDSPVSAVPLQAIAVNREVQAACSVKQSMSLTSSIAVRFECKYVCKYSAHHGCSCTSFSRKLNQSTCL